jgi:hypothetical protein
MADWIGLLFFILLIAGVFVGLKVLSKPEKRAEADFGKNAAESASILGIGMSALQGLMDPTAAKAKEVKMQMKEGRYQKKKREGKANKDDLNEEYYER